MAADSTEHLLKGGRATVDHLVDDVVQVGGLVVVGTLLYRFVAHLGDAPPG